MVEILDLELIVKKIKTIGYFFGGLVSDLLAFLRFFTLLNPDL